MDAITMLRGTRKLLDHPDTWTKGAHARDLNANGVEPLDPTATCFCLDGAMYRVEQEKPSSITTPAHARADRTLDLAAAELYPERTDGDFGCFVNFNDHTDTTHEDVLKVLDRAIELSSE